MDDVYYLRSKNFSKQSSNFRDVSELMTEAEEMTKDHPKDKKNRLIVWLRNFFVDFCNETSIHGFNHMVAPGRHVFEKICWVIVTALAALGAMELCRQQWQRFVESPTVVSLEKDYRNWNNTFPAITACVKNTINETVAIRLIEQQWGVKENDEKFGYYMEFIRTVANANMKHLEVFQKYASDPTLKGVDLFRIADEIVPQFIVKANWFDQSMNLTFLRVMTDMGVCFTINSVVSGNQAIRQLLPKEEIVLRKEPITCQFETHPCYVKFESNDYCTEYYLHSPYEIIDKTSSMTAEACAGQDFDTDWKVTETKSSADVLALAISRRNCRYHNEPPNDKQTVYSPAICRRECRNALFLKECGCRSYFDFQENGPQCDVTGMVCLAKVFVSSRDNCKCLPSCVDATYELANNRETRWKGPFGKRCALKAGIIAPRSRYRRQILFYFEDLVVSFGGAAGLFLGCSFLSGAEIIYFVLERLGTALLNFLKCAKSKKEKDDNIRRPKHENPLEAIENRERYGMKNFISQIAEYD